MKIRIFKAFLVLLMALTAASCGEFLGIGSGRNYSIEGTREAGTGFDGGKVISETQTGRYTIEHRLNVNPQDGYTESTHYSLQPGH